MKPPRILFFKDRVSGRMFMDCMDTINWLENHVPRKDKKTPAQLLYDKMGATEIQIDHKIEMRNQRGTSASWTASPRVVPPKSFLQRLFGL